MTPSNGHRPPLRCFEGRGLRGGEAELRRSADEGPREADAWSDGAKTVGERWWKGIDLKNKQQNNWANIEVDKR